MPHNSTNRHGHSCANHLTLALVVCQAHGALVKRIDQRRLPIFLQLGSINAPVQASVTIKVDKQTVGHSIADASRRPYGSRWTHLSSHRQAVNLEPSKCCLAIHRVVHRKGCRNRLGL